jgi:ferric-dicitrate binding protein FerR (iron transport regulator)
VRYLSAADLRVELKRLKRDTDSSRSHPTVTSPSGASVVPARRKRRWPYAAAAAAILAGAALFWFARPLPSPRISNMVQITNDGRPKNWPLLTDGSRLFFNSVNYEAYQVSVKGGESVLLALSAKNAHVDISPDHTELLLCRHTVLSAPCELLAAPLSHTRKLSA